MDHLKSNKLKTSHIAATIKRKTSAESTRNNSTYVKVRSQKSNTQVEFLKTKASSDELVKYLMKKVKVQPRSGTNKKKVSGSTASQVNLSSKTKFMQSATSSMVNDVLNKKENDYLMPMKSGSRISFDKNDIFAKPSHQHKMWSIKYNDSNVSFDIKRPSTQNRLNRSTYLSDDSDDLSKENYLQDRNLRYSNRIYDGSLKMEPKEASEKYSKRQEVKNMLSKLEFRSNLYRMAKVKQKDQKKKAVQNILDNLVGIESKENFSGRFQHQHDLFKNNNLKSAQGNDRSHGDFEKSTNENLMQCNPACSSTEIACIDKGFQLIPNESSGGLKYETPEHSSKTLPISSEDKENTGLSVLRPLNVDGNLFNKTLDKQFTYQNKLCKTKLLQYAKEEHINALIDPLLDNCVREGQNPKGTSTNVHESRYGTQELRHVKVVDRTLGSSKHSSNPVYGSSKHKNKAISLNYKGYSPALEKDTSRVGDLDKKLSKGKRKDKSKKPQSDESQSSNHCCFEKNKSGSKCEGELLPS